MGMNMMWCDVFPVWQTYLTLKMHSNGNFGRQQNRNNGNNLLEPEALGKLSTELAEHANAWSLILPRSVLSWELLKSLEVSFVATKFLPFSLNTPISFGELRISLDFIWFEVSGSSSNSSNDIIVYKKDKSKRTKGESLLNH